MALPDLSVRRPVATVMFYTAVVLLGVISLLQLSVDLFPDLNYPRLLVRTVDPDAAPEEVQEFVTRPVEEAVSAVSGLRQVVSRSRTGLSLVTLEFYWGTRMDYAALSVREKLDEIRYLLPQRAERPQVLLLDPSARPMMEVAVSGAPIEQLTDLCRQVIRRRLEQLPGVAMVEVVGGVDRQILVEIDPHKLLTQHLTVQEVADALKQNNVALSGGSILKGRYRYAIRVEGRFQNLEDIRQVGIFADPGRPLVHIGDIAQVSWFPQEQQSLTRLNGRETVGLLITKEAGSNTVQVTGQVEATLQQIRQQFPELEFFVVSQQAQFIRNSIQNVLSSLVWGGILAFLSLFLFLHEFRYPLAIGLSMPISILATFVVMKFTGVQLNMMSLGGLALGVGMLVDNSIVVLENIFRLHEEGAGWVRASVEGAREVALAILASTLTTCAVFLPIIYVQGIAGQLFRDLSLTVVFSLLASLLVSLTLLPVLTSRFQGRRKPPERQPDFYRTAPVHRTRLRRWLSAPFRAVAGGVHLLAGLIQRLYQWAMQPLFGAFDRFFQGLYARYHRLLLAALRHKRLALGTAVILLLLTLLLGTQLDRRFLPRLNPDEFRYYYQLPPDATLYQTDEIGQAIARNFLQMPQVQYVFNSAGISQSIFQAAELENVNQGVLIVRRLPGSHISPTDFEQLLMRHLPRSYTIQGHFEGGEQLYTDLLGLQAQDFQMDIKGPSYDLLLPVARALQDSLSRLPGFEEVQTNYRPGGTEYRITIDRQEAARLGLTVQQIADMIQARIQGVVATQMRRFDRTIDIRVRPSLNWRTRWSDLTRSVFNLGRFQLPIQELVHTQEVQRPDELFRKNQQPTIELSAMLHGLKQQDAMARFQKLVARLPMPEEVRIEPSGQQREIQASFRSLRWALLLSIVLVYMILAAQFESFKHPLVIMMAVPFGIIGGVWALWLTGSSLNVISGIGFV
ncbi:MAG: efflux RND transporter permease subunit, partial [Calditrichaeota bacterium]